MIKKPKFDNKKEKEEFQEFLKGFRHKNIKFEVSAFEELMLNDIYQFDESTKIKLNRNVTKMFFDEMQLYHDQKRNIRYNIKGETRSGKSYTGLKITEIILTKNGVDFNERIDYFVCGNQIEYRQKLKDAKFGEFYLVDENYFTRAGLGANIEYSQLMDYNNIIAKKNIGSIFITPEKFLNVGSVLGFSTYGRDSKNWLSRMLVFKFKDGFPYLIGYVIVDIGDLFRKYGCYVYKLTGGCTNSKRIEYDKIPKDVLKYSWAIPEEYKFNYEKLEPTIERIENGDIANCPFYNVCHHGICKYEKKKDSWIEKELSGGLDERSFERFKLACQLILELSPEIIPEANIMKLQAKNGKDLKLRVKLKVHNYTNSKMGIAEFDELIEMVKSNTDISMLADTLYQLDLKDLREEFFALDMGDLIREQYDQIKKKREAKAKE